MHRRQVCRRTNRARCDQDPHALHGRDGYHKLIEFTNVKQPPLQDGAGVATQWSLGFLRKSARSADFTLKCSTSPPRPMVNGTSTPAGPSPHTARNNSAKPFTRCEPTPSTRSPI